MVDPGTAVVIALIAAVPPTLVALGALIVGLRNSAKVDDARDKSIIAADRAEVARQEAISAKAEIVMTKDGVFEVGKQLDGRLKELLEATRRAALAEGNLAGRAAAATLAQAVSEVEVPVATRSEREDAKEGGG